MSPRLVFVLLACTTYLAEPAGVDAARTLLTLTRQQYDAAVELPILSPVPLTGAWTGGHTMRISAELAMDIVNSQQLLLPGYRLNTSWFDDRCDPDYNLKLVLQQWNDGSWVAMGGNGCAEVCRTAALGAPNLRLPYSSYGCPAGALGDSATFPDFTRYQADENRVAGAYLSLARRYQWDRVVMITSDPARFDGPARAIADRFRSGAGPPVDVEWLTPHNPTWPELLIMMEDIRRSFQRVVVVLGYEAFYRRVICAAATAGVVKGVVWLSLGWHKDGWWAERDADLLALDARCTSDLVTEYADGAIAADGLGAPADAEMDRQLDCLPGWTPRSFRGLVAQYAVQGYPVGLNALPEQGYGTLQGVGADGVCMWAYMLRYMLVQQGYNLSQLVRPAPAVYKKMRDFIKNQLDFFGVTGRVKFDGNNLPGTYGVTQVQAGRRLAVFTMDADGALKLLPGSKLIWADNSTSPATRFQECAAGYRLLQSGVCDPCAPGTYDDHELEGCVPCPAGRSSASPAAPNATSCRRCAAGGVANTTGSSACTPCPIGTFADATADEALTCALCPEGRRQGTPGASECAQCELGRFSAGLGSTECSVCPQQATTRTLGADSEDDCVCAAGAYSKPALGCVGCEEGLSCPGGNDHPLQAAGYHVEVVDEDARSYSGYHCRSIQECPLGPMGTCADGREGRACARCVPGTYPLAQGICVPCAMKGHVMPFLIGGIAVVLAAVVPTCLFSQGAGQTSTMLLLTIVLAQLTASVKSIGGLGEFRIAWIEPIKSFLQGISFFNFDFDVIRVSCAFPRDDPILRLVVQLLALPMALLAMCGTFVLAWALRRHRNRHEPDGFNGVEGGHLSEIEPLLNSAGLLGIVALIPLTITMTEAMRCSHNPNGSMSMVKNPGVICWHSQEHRVLMAISIVGLLVYPVVIITVVVRATWAHDVWLATGQGISKLRAHRFLFDRFTPARYKYGTFYVIRNAIISVIPAIFVGQAMLEVLMTVLLFLISLVVQVSWRPWRRNQANYTDTLATMGLTFFVAASAFLLNVPVETSISILQVLILAALTVVTIALASGVAGWLREKVCAQKPYAMFLCHHKAGAGVLCRYIKVVVTRSARVDVFLDSDQLEDLQNIVEAVRAWTQTLVVVLTKDVLKRIWCAAEIVSGHMNKVPTVCVTCDDFHPMQDDERARLGELWTPEQRQTALTPYRVTLDMVFSAYTWLTTLRNVKMPRFGNPAEKGAAVSSLMEECKVRRRGVFATVHTNGKNASIVVLGAVSDAECLSTCEVVALILQYDLQAETMVLRTPSDAHLVVRSAKYAVVVLSNKILTDAAFAASLLAVTKAPGRREPLEIVTVLASGAGSDQGFSFPDGAFYQKLEAEGLGKLPGKPIAAAYREMLLILALPLSPLGSMGLIEKQLSEIARRFRRVRRAEDSMQGPAKLSATPTKSRSLSGLSGATPEGAAARKAQLADAAGADEEDVDPFDLMSDGDAKETRVSLIDDDESGWLSERSL